MGDLKWRRHDHNDALRGMIGMSMVERGVYYTLLDLLYANDGALADDPSLIAHMLHVKIAMWKRHRTKLIEAGKIYVHAGAIRNERCDKEIEKARERIRLAASKNLVAGTNGRQLTDKRRPFGGQKVLYPFDNPQDRPKKT